MVGGAGQSVGLYYYRKGWIMEGRKEGRRRSSLPHGGLVGWFFRPERLWRRAGRSFPRSWRNICEGG